MTLTLLLQLTDEEQLYAQAPLEAPATTTETTAPQTAEAAPAFEVVLPEEQNG
ncbi:MAG: hypothetical protein IT229_05535 [Flavobacteriales bacterium]|nr:hypothetical protein [Flavobacteriales bacterium]